MASEIKVDTVSEKTSGSGVTIDGLLIKDGGISGDVSLIGTTPTFTIGDAGAEDAALVFDGNAQDFYIALDDSADDLIIGLGAAVGTTPMLSFTEAKAAAFTGAVTMATTLGVTGAVTSAALTASGILKTDDATEATSTTDGALQTDGGLSVVKDAVFGDDVKLLSDSSVIAFGADGDTTLTHTDGTGLTLNSTNKLCFNDASQFVQGSSATVLSIGATDEIDLTATAVDLNGTLDVSGASTLTGLVTVAAGINFPDTQAASADANTLDDYEEGTWTPVYTSTGATITSGSTTGGAYVKIGRLVTVQGSTCTGGNMSGGTAGNSVGISGLPFANSDDTAGENMRPTGTFDGWLSTYTWGGDIPSVMQVTNDASSMYLAYRDVVDGYAITTRFDDLADNSGNPRNLAYFSISYIAAA
jgi:hypothetical protein